MKPKLKVNDFVLGRNGAGGYITEIHAANKTALARNRQGTVRIRPLGFYHYTDANGLCYDLPSNKVTLVTQEDAWKAAPDFPGYDV